MSTTFLSQVEKIIIEGKYTVLSCPDAQKRMEIHRRRWYNNSVNGSKSEISVVYRKKYGGDRMNPEPDGYDRSRITVCAAVSSLSPFLPLKNGAFGL